MSTSSKANVLEETSPVLQGDVYRNVKYNYIDTEDNDTVDVVEFEFPLAIVISQACDSSAMEEIVRKKGGKATKFMPSILLCPIYDKAYVRNGDHLQDVFTKLDLSLESESVYHSDDYKVAQRDWHYRFHALEVTIGGKVVISNAIIDFKHYFTVPMSYLVKNKKNRSFRLDDLYAEQLALKFATYLSRVAIPEDTQTNAFSDKSLGSELANLTGRTSIGNGIHPDD